MFRAVWQINIYSNNCTQLHKIIYIQTCGNPPTCFGFFRPSSGKYSTKENITMIFLMFFWPCIMKWLYINYQLWCTDYYLFIKYYSPPQVSSLKCSSSGGYSCTHAAYGTVTLYESSWWLVEDINILWINNNQCTKVGN